LAVELDNLPYGPLSVWKSSERPSTEIKKISFAGWIGSKVEIGTNSDPLGSFWVISSSFTFFGNCVINYRVPVKKNIQIRSLDVSNYLFLLYIKLG
jgi:hypothetical protein